MATDEYNENEEIENEDYESDYEEENEEDKPKKGSRIVLIIAVLALVGLNVYLGVNIYNQTEDLKRKEAEIAKLDSQRTELLGRVDSLKVSIEQFKGTISLKDDSLDMLYKKVAEMQKDLKGKQATINTLWKYKKQVDELRKFEKMANDRKAEIERLEKQLAAEKERAEKAESANDTLTNKLNEIEALKSKLENKVELGSRLKGAISYATGMKQRRNSVKETTRAGQADALRVDYSINANNIAEKGKKEAYIVVKMGNKALTDDDLSFESSNGKIVDYTFKDEFTYDGEQVKRSVLIPAKQELKEGKYQVEIYINQKLMTTGSFSLR